MGFTEVMQFQRNMIMQFTKAFLVAEIGINHNGDISLAEDMICAAAEAGADAVKFQNYRTEDFLSDRNLLYTYTGQGRWAGAHAMGGLVGGFCGGHTAVL